MTEGAPPVIEDELDAEETSSRRRGSRLSWLVDDEFRELWVYS